MKVDFPMLAQVQGVIKLQQQVPGEPIIERKIARAKTTQEFGIAWLAACVIHGREFEPANDFQAEGVRLARGWVKNGWVYEDLKCVEAGLVRLTREGEVGGAVGVGPSDAARRQAREHREKNGSTYVGCRFVRKKESPVRRFSDALPLHWMVGITQY